MRLFQQPAKIRRLRSLVRKETRQIVRDPSSIAIGIVLPVLLILLFGYGLSLDVTNAPVAVVLEDVSPAATDLAALLRVWPSSRRAFSAARTCCSSHTRLLI